MMSNVLRIVRHEVRLLSRNMRAMLGHVVAVAMLGLLLLLAIRSGNDQALTGLFATLILAAALAPAFNIAVHALVGEKERGTMESLLLLPVSPLELVTAKLGLATGLAAIGVAVVLGAAPTAVVLWGRPAQIGMLFNSLTLWVAIVLAPLTSAMCCLVVIVISGRATNTQAATNLSMVVTLPLALLLLGWMFGNFRIGWTHLASVTVVLSIIVGVLLWLCPAALEPHVLIRRRS